MIHTLNNFDPINYLGIDISSFSTEQIIKLRIDLNNKIGEYILLKLSDNLTSDQLENVIFLTKGNQIVNELANIIPDFKQKILQELENFKAEYQTIN